MATDIEDVCGSWPEVGFRDQKSGVCGKYGFIIFCTDAQYNIIIDNIKYVCMKKKYVFQCRMRGEKERKNHTPTHELIYLLFAHEKISK